jgi:hypothetical protein
VSLGVVGRSHAPKGRNRLLIQLSILVTHRQQAPNPGSHQAQLASGLQPEMPHDGAPPGPTWHPPTVQVLPWEL